MSAKVKNKRKSISKKVRFEVFKRDSFTCQYCGRSAPDVILQIDHIKAVSNGGENDILNYATSCYECNIGKGARDLSDHQTLSKQKKQLEELNERREQLKMMVEWKDGLEKLRSEEIKYVVNLLKKKSGIKNLELNDYGKKLISNAIEKYGFDEIYDCTKLSFDQYFDEHHSSFDNVIKYIPRIANRKQKDLSEPYMKDLYYIRGILNNRLTYCNKDRAITALQAAYLDAGATIEELRDLALTVKNWTQLRNTMQEKYEVEI